MPLSAIFQLYRGSQYYRENKVPGENHWPATLYHMMFIEYTSPRSGFKLKTLVVIGADCIGSSNSNYHTITTGPNNT